MVPHIPLLRVVIALVLILVVGMSAIVALPEPPEPKPRGGREWMWAPFHARNGAYAAPAGWSGTDSFTTATPHSGFAASEPVCSLTTHIAYLRRHDDGAEIFLLHGATVELEAMVRATGEVIDSCVDVHARDRGEIDTADDGAPLSWATTRAGLGLAGNRDHTYFVALRESGGETVLLSGGAPSGNFVLDEFLAIARSVRAPDGD